MTSGPKFLEVRVEGQNERLLAKFEPQALETNAPSLTYNVSECLIVPLSLTKIEIYFLKTTSTCCNVPINLKFSQNATSPMNYRRATRHLVRGGLGGKFFWPTPLNIFRGGGKKNVCYT